MDIKSIAMGICFAVIWSSAFSFARLIVEQAPPLSISCLRFLIGGVLAIAMAYFLGQRVQFNKKNLLAICVFGLCQNAVYLGLFFVAMQNIEASLASIIASSMPLIITLAGFLFLGEKPSSLGLVGLLIGFLGVLLIMGNRISAGSNYLSILLCVGGVMALAIATLSVRHVASSGNVLMVVGLQMLVGSAALLGPALWLETAMIHWTASLIMMLAYSILLPGICATVIWFLLIERVGATKASSFHFLNPFFGVVIAAIFLGENLGYIDLIAVVIITLGIGAIQMSKKNEGN